MMLKENGLVDNAIKVHRLVRKIKHVGDHLSYISRVATSVLIKW